MSIQPSIQKNTYTTRHFIKGMASRGLAPLILLESTVIAGRTYQANERGGFYEARERVTEETLGAVFWFSGVQGFNKLIDYFIGQKILKLPETNFDVGKDSLHNPLENYIKRLSQLEEVGNHIPGVEKSYAVQAGRELRVIVKPEEVDDLEAHKIAREVKEQIEANMKYPGTIKITVVRETRAQEEAK